MKPTPEQIKKAVIKLKLLQQMIAECEHKIVPRDKNIREKLKKDKWECIFAGISRSWRKRMRNRSGKENSNKPLVAFLYILMRDHLPAGVVEGIMKDQKIDKKPCQYTNGWLARYAKDLAGRLQ